MRFETVPGIWWIAWSVIVFILGQPISASRFGPGLVLQISERPTEIVEHGGRRIPVDAPSLSWFLKNAHPLSMSRAYNIPAEELLWCNALPRPSRGSAASAWRRGMCRKNVMDSVIRTGSQFAALVAVSAIQRFRPPCESPR